jgi:hypothetical protein
MFNNESEHLKIDLTWRFCSSDNLVCPKSSVIPTILAKGVLISCEIFSSRLLFDEEISHFSSAGVISLPSASLFLISCRISISSNGFFKNRILLFSLTLEFNHSTEKSPYEYSAIIVDDGFCLEISSIFSAPFSLLTFRSVKITRYGSAFLACLAAKSFNTW